MMVWPFTPANPGCCCCCSCSVRPKNQKNGCQENHFNQFVQKKKKQCWWISHRRRRIQNHSAHRKNAELKTKSPLLSVRLSSSPLILSFDLDLAESCPGLCFAGPSGSALLQTGSSCVSREERRGPIPPVRASKLFLTRR